MNEAPAASEPLRPRLFSRVWWGVRAGPDVTLRLALVAAPAGKFAEAESLFREAVASCKETLDGHHPDTLVSINNLAHLLKSMGEAADPRPLLCPAPAHPSCSHHCPGNGGRQHRRQAASSLLSSRRSSCIASAGRLEESEALCREALAAQRATLGDRHPDTLSSINNLALLLGCTGARG